MKFQVMDAYRLTMSSHQELDDQQLQFIEVGNTYLQAYNKGKHAALVESTIIYLSDYTKRHFVTQEAYMALHSYPGINKHIAHHTEYVREVAKGLKMLITYKSTSSSTIFETLGTNIGMLISDWFEFHIVQADKRLNEFIRFETIEEKP